MDRSRKSSQRRKRNTFEPEQELRPGIDFRLIGYARVSTSEQNLAMQLEALRRVGVMEENLYTDKASGRTLKRKGLQEALLDVRPGDQFVVWKLDRLSRSALDILYLSKKFKDESVHLRSLHESIDTTTPFGMVVLQILAALAEFESAQTGFRTKRGMDTAAREGRRFGPVPRIDKSELPEIAKRLRAGESAEAVGRSYSLTGQRIRQIILEKYGKPLWKPKKRKTKLKQ